MSFLIFLLWLIVLIAEGALLASIIFQQKLQKNVAVFFVSMSLPLAALLNVLVVFLFTILSIPLLFWTMILGHGLVIIALLLINRRHQTAVHPFQEIHHKYRGGFFFSTLRIVCVALLCVQTFFSFSHSVILPTFPIDSLTNWTMRSKVSFYDHAIAFDQTEKRGVAKPQYPFLFHALQITVNEGNTQWNDRSANSILFLLTLFAFAALFLMLKMQKGVDTAVIGITLITSIPLLTFHLSGGYADVTLLQFLCLSLITLQMWSTRREKSWLMLSALFVAASVWTKSEGLFIGLIPWLLFLALDLRHADRRTFLGKPLIIVLCLSLMYPLFLLLHGMGLTPHDSDTSFQWHPDAFLMTMRGLFLSGSMGVTWFAIVIGSLLGGWLLFTQDHRIDRSSAVFGLWGLFSLLLILFTYIFTPNATFLANGESYYRQLMIPAALFLLWGATLFE